MTNDLDTLATALYARIDDELKASPWLAPWRPAVGITPTLSDAELITLAVMSALLGYTSERRWLRRVGRDFGHLFPYVPQQSGYNKRLRAAFSLLTSMIRIVARDTSLWSDHVWLVDSTPVGCGCSRETVKRSDLAGWAQYGYCASHSRYFWGLRLHLVCTLGGLPVLFALTGAKADERETLRDMLDTAPDVLAVHPGQTIIGDKNYFGREFEHGLAERHLKFCGPPARGKPSRPGHTCSSRCGRSSSRSIRPSRGSSTWNDTAARARQGRQPGSCAGSSHSQRRSGTTTRLDSAHQAVTHCLRSLTATTPLGLIRLDRVWAARGADSVRRSRSQSVVHGLVELGSPQAWAANATRPMASRMVDGMTSTSCSVNAFHSCGRRSQPEIWPALAALPSTASRKRPRTRRPRPSRARPRGRNPRSEW